MAAIHFETTLFKLGSWTILRLPKDASAKLPSRGQVMVNGTINDFAFALPLEPDGKWSHWLKLDAGLQRGAQVAAGDVVTVSIEVSTTWPDPAIPADLQLALNTSEAAADLWTRITPMARWEWLRWIRSTGRQETRQRRIAVAISKLESGKRRPCCWNRNLCTEPSVSKNGVLLEPVPLSAA